MRRNFKLVFVMMICSIPILWCGFMPSSNYGPTEAAKYTKIAVTVRQHRTEYPITVSAELTKIGLEGALTQIPRSLSNSQNWLDIWLYNPVCQPPCWERIIPGKTTLNEAIRIIGQIDGVKFDSLNLTPHVNIKTMAVSWNFDADDRGIVITGAGTELIERIELFPSGERGLTIEKVINAYGNPSTIVRGGCMSEFFPPAWCKYALVFADKGMVIYLQLDAAINKPVELKPEISIGGVVIFSPDNIRAFDLDYLDADSLEWEGYKTYEFPVD